MMMLVEDHLLDHNSWLMGTKQYIKTFGRHTTSQSGPHMLSADYNSPLELIHIDDLDPV